VTRACSFSPLHSLLFPALALCPLSLSTPIVLLISTASAPCHFGPFCLSYSLELFSHPLINAAAVTTTATAATFPPLLQAGSDRETGQQSFREAWLLHRLAVTQKIYIQRLIPGNKGDLPYIPFRAGYRNGGLHLVPYMVTCYFIGHFNLWGKVTLPWSHSR
jgi:hypothetical protein